ncbi:MAG: flagellar filament capping protein FliD [Betaproteobacteria bacterium]
MADFFPIPPIRTSVPTGISPTAPAATGGATAPLAPGGASAIVQLSAYGQMLSSVGGFQNTMASLRQRFELAAGGRDFFANLGTASAGAQALADSFNQLQGRIDEIRIPLSGGAGGSRLGDAFQQALSAQATATFNNGDSIFTALARIGINYQPSAVPAAGGKLSVDTEALQNALNYDTAGTFTLLSKATQALDDVATRFAGRTGNAAMAAGLLAQMQATQMALGAAGDGSGIGDLTGLSDQAALALVPGDATGARQRGIALNQFNRIAAFY